MKKPKILVSLLTNQNHYQRRQESAALEMGQRLGVDVQVIYANNDAITQSEQMLNAIQAPQSRPDGIICYPVGTTLHQAARQAASAGIGWAVLNRECDYIAELRGISKAPFFSVTTNNDEIGRIQGRQIAKLSPGSGMVLHLIGPSVSSIVHRRTSGMQSTKPAGIQIRTLAGDWSETGGYNVVSRWLQLKTAADTPVTLVAAQNDDMAVGARRAFEEKTSGSQRERWTHVPYIGCDCCPGAGETWVHKGLLTASIVNPATAGMAVELMARAIQTNTQPAERTVVEPTSYPPLETLTPAPASAS
jgi:ribose transport system substrate-binding protein